MRPAISPPSSHTLTVRTQHKTTPDGHNTVQDNRAAAGDIRSDYADEAALGDLVVFLLPAFFAPPVAFLAAVVVFFLGAAFLVVDLVEAAFLLVVAFLVALVGFLAVLAFLVDEEEPVECEADAAVVDAFLADFLAASPSANFCPVFLSTPLSTPRFRACRTRESLFFASRSACDSSPFLIACLLLPPRVFSSLITWMIAPMYLPPPLLEEDVDDDDDDEA